MSEAIKMILWLVAIGFSIFIFLAAGFIAALFGVGDASFIVALLAGIATLCIIIGTNADMPHTDNILLQCNTSELKDNHYGCMHGCYYQKMIELDVLQNATSFDSYTDEVKPCLYHCLQIFNWSK